MELRFDRGIVHYWSYLWKGSFEIREDATTYCAIPLVRCVESCLGSIWLYGGGRHFCWMWTRILDVVLQIRCSVKLVVDSFAMLLCKLCAFGRETKRLCNSRCSVQNGKSDRARKPAWPQSIWSTSARDKLDTRKEQPDNARQCLEISSMMQSKKDGLKTCMQVIKSGII